MCIASYSKLGKIYWSQQHSVLVPCACCLQLPVLAAAGVRLLGYAVSVSLKLFMYYE